MAHRNSTVTHTVTLQNAPAPIAPAATTPEEILEQLAAEQAQLAERIATVRGMLARGTGDVTQAAAAARAAVALTPPALAPSLTERVEGALRTGVWSLDDLCREVRAPAGPVSAILKRARAARHVYNVGSEDRPRWTWILGDEVPTQTLYAKVERLVSEVPLEFEQLLKATGARRGRVSGAIVDLQKRYGRDKVLNLGTPARARWFLPKTGSAAGGSGARAARRAA